MAAAGDALIIQGNLVGAEAKFIEIGKKDIGNAYALKQLGVIKQLKLDKAVEDADVKKLVAIKSNAVKFQTSKKYKEAISEQEKGLKLKVSQGEKDKLNIEIASLNTNLKSAALELEIANELKATKILNSTGAYDKSKLGYVKIDNLITQLLTEESKKIQRDLVNKQIDESIGKELKTAYDFNSKNQYDKAIERFLAVLKAEPTNVEAVFHIAESYDLKGDKANAIVYYEKAKQLVNIPQAKEELNKRIIELRK